MQEYDYIIVGAGSAGCVLANRITADPSLKVLVLEAGGRDLHPYVHMPLTWRTIWQGPLYNWMYKTEPEPYLDGRKMALPRGKVLGGSSIINGMVYIRGQHEDFDLWRQMGNAGWSAQTCCRTSSAPNTRLRGADDWHGTGGPLRVRRPDKHAILRGVHHAAVDLGYPANARFQRRDPGWRRLPPDHHGNGRRCSTAVGYLKPATRRRNSAVVTGALAERILSRTAARSAWSSAGRLLVHGPRAARGDPVRRRDQLAAASAAVRRRAADASDRSRHSGGAPSARRRPGDAGSLLGAHQAEMPTPDHGATTSC